MRASLQLKVPFSKTEVRHGGKQNESREHGLLWVLVLGAIATATALVAAEVVEEVIPLPNHKEVDVITAEPSNEHVWIPGYWGRNAGNWKWVKARWERPPHRSARWVNGQWKYEAGRWHWEIHGKRGQRWLAGHWVIRK